MKDPGPRYLKKRYFTTIDAVEALPPLDRQFVDTLIAVGDIIVLQMGEQRVGSEDVHL